jgi:hypothetical protein
MASRSFEIYELSPRNSDLDAIEAAFPSYLKLRSICWLLRLGARSTRGIVLSSGSKRTIAAAVDYAKSQNWAQFLLRYDRPPEQARTLQGGILVNVDELQRWVVRFVEGGVCILLEPFDAVQNGYNISCLVDRSRAWIEVAGPGFDASDLQRGQIVPHEIRSLSVDYGTFGISTVIADDVYQESLKDRERKVWWKYCVKELDTSRWANLSEIELANCRRIITEIRGAPIPSRYKPIPTYILQRYCRNLLQVIRAWCEQFQGPAVFASSFVQTGDLVFWDVSTKTRWIGHRR